MGLGIDNAANRVTLGLVEKVNALHLLPIALLPDMKLLLVVADEASQVWVVKNVFYMATSCVPFVSCSKFVPEF